MVVQIVFLARSLEVGGAEVQLTELAKSLGESQRFSVTIITLYKGGELEKNLAQSKVSLISMDKTGRWDLIRWIPKLVTTIRNLKPDILHSYLGPPNIIAALLRLFIRPKRLFWGIRASEMDFSHYDWSWRIVNNLEKLLSRIPDGIIVNSYAGEKLLKKRGYPDSRIHVIHNGIDIHKFFSKPSAGMELRKKWLAGRSGPLIGLVARLDPMKDHLTFLRAATILSKNFPSAKFVCIGGGKDRYLSELKAFAFSLGLDSKIIWAGEQKNMLAVWNALDLATLTSAFGEGFPNAVGEAMACGIPCVATDVGDVRIIISNDLFITPCRNPNLLASAWSEELGISEEEREVLCRNNRTRISQEFSIKSMVSKTKQAYQVFEDSV